MQDVLLNHYDLHDEKRKETTTGVLEYVIYLLSTALAQFLAFGFAIYVGIRHFFLKTKIHFKHIGIYFEIKVQDSNNKGV